MAAGDLAVEILEQADACMAALVGPRGIAGELEEVEPVRYPQRARKVGDEDDARLELRNEQRLASVVVALQVAAELAPARLQLLVGGVDLAEAGAAAYDARSRRHR